MRNHDDRDLALECLKLAASVDPFDAPALAERYYAFVTGTEADDSKAKLAAVREVVG